MKRVEPLIWVQSLNRKVYRVVDIVIPDSKLPGLVSARARSLPVSLCTGKGEALRQ